MRQARIRARILPRLIGASLFSLAFTACVDQALPTSPPRGLLTRASGGSPLVLPSLSVPADTFHIPVVDETLSDVDMCAALPGLCGASICPAGDITGPSSAKKGTGFALKGCGNISSFVFKTIKAKMSGEFVFGASIDPAQIGVDPGCVEKTITIPATPFIPGTPPILGPFGNVIWPGTPAIPARPASTFTVRIPLGCDPVRPPSIDHPASLAGFEAFAHPKVDVELEVEASGSGEVELRIPVPKLAKTLRVPVGEEASNSAHMLSAAVGVYLVFRGRLTETATRFVAKVTEEFTTSFTFDAASGWTGAFNQGPFDVTGSIDVQSPDTTAFRYGVQPAVSVQLEPFPPPILGLLAQRPGFQIEAGLWVNRYFENIFSGQPSTGNLKNDANSGLEGRVYAGYKGLEPGQEGPCARENILGCLVDAFAVIPQDAFDRPFTCCESDLYEQYGVGLFKFEGKTTGEEIDLDPDGYTLSWTRTNTTPYPYVDDVMTASLGTRGETLYPDVPGAVSNLPYHPFDVPASANCIELRSDILMSGPVLSELRRHGLGPAPFSRIFGCTQLPADYTLTVSGFAVNCTPLDPNPRTVRLRPLLNLSNLGAAVKPITWSQVSDRTDVDINVHCRPLVGDLRLTTTTTGLDADPDGYALSLDGAPAGSVAANGASTLPGIRVGNHTVGIDGVSFNCAVAIPNPQAVSIQFETTTEAAAQVSCVSVYAKLAELVRAAEGVGRIVPWGIEYSLVKKLESAESARGRGDVAAVKGLLEGFVSEVQAQQGRNISSATATELLAQVAYIVANGYFMPGT